MKPGDIETTRDYDKRLAFKLYNEIMSLNFGNSVSLSMEGVSVRHFSKEKLMSLYITIKFYLVKKRDFNVFSLPSFR